MKEIRFQKIKGKPVPYDVEDKMAWGNYPENMITVHRVRGSRKQRSWQQHKMFMGLIRKVSENARDTNWNTYEKAKFNLKVQLHFVDDEVTIVIDKEVKFKYSSFSYDNINHMDFCGVFERSIPILAAVLGNTEEELLGEIDE